MGNFRVRSNYILSDADDDDSTVSIASSRRVALT